MKRLFAICSLLLALCSAHAAVTLTNLAAQLADPAYAHEKALLRAVSGFATNLSAFNGGDAVALTVQGNTNDAFSDLLQVLDGDGNILVWVDVDGALHGDGSGLTGISGSGISTLNGSGTNTFIRRQLAVQANTGSTSNSFEVRDSNGMAKVTVSSNGATLTASNVTAQGTVSASGAVTGSSVAASDNVGLVRLLFTAGPRVQFVGGGQVVLMNNGSSGAASLVMGTATPAVANQIITNSPFGFEFRNGDLSSTTNIMASDVSARDVLYRSNGISVATITASITNGQCWQGMLSNKLMAVCMSNNAVTFTALTDPLAEVLAGDLDLNGNHINNFDTANGADVNLTGGVNATGEVKAGRFTFGTSGSITNILRGSATIDFPAVAQGENIGVAHVLAGTQFGDPITLGVTNKAGVFTAVVADTGIVFQFHNTCGITTNLDPQVIKYVIFQ
jgi:hypothetical protein